MAEFLSFITSWCVFSMFFCCTFAEDGRKVYIAYMGSLPENNYSPLDDHHSILQEVLQSSTPSNSLIHSYKRSFNGFSANLTENERIKLESMEGIVSVFPNEDYKILTTKSWDFLGLKEDVKRVPTVESDLIVGVIDTGIWPESESFTDQGFSPPPKKWKGVCNGGKNFTCNNKIIGARYYGSGDARDALGHGTHTASTAAGNRVNNVSFYGLAQGNARGGVPSARIAVYKVCSADSECTSANILAAFDDAISDGVDVLSVSLGGEDPVDYLKDAISIGSFHAMRKGILTSQAAGNSGPATNTAVANAPWVLSVAASSINRQIVDTVILGDNTTLVGRAVNSFDSITNLPLVEVTPYGRINLQSNGNENQGKILFYSSYNRGEQALLTNASGIIITSDGLQGFTSSYTVPAALLSTADASRVKSYVNKTRNPVASILKSVTLQDSSSPVVASFSARGPNPITADILKPDITAPGSDIIAAWSPIASPSGDTGDERSVKYNILSGTSMSCPHATGATVFVKTFHPDWSPSAIKSALMTTAYPLNATANPDAELAYGAGHIDPVKAVNPGLVYDANEVDYINMLCSIYSSNQVRIISGDKITVCPGEKVPVTDLNYPSMTTVTTETTFTRTVTNVGSASSTYTATVKSTPSLRISVEPNSLSFKSLNEKKSFVVKVSLVERVPKRKFYSASLVWSDGIHIVRSPIVYHSDSSNTEARS